MDNSLTAVVTLQCNSKTSTIMESKNYYDPHRSYPVGRCLTIVIAHPEILDPPQPQEACVQSTSPDVGAQYIAPAQFALTSPAQSEPTPDACPQSTTPAQPELTQTTPTPEVAQYSKRRLSTKCTDIALRCRAAPQRLNPTCQRHDPTAWRLCNTLAPPKKAIRFPKPPQPKHSKWSAALGRPIISLSKPRRGALMFSPMWSAAQHGVSIQAKGNEPRRGAIVLPSKSTPALRSPPL